MIECARRGEECDFTDSAEPPTPEQMATWGPERTIRASFLRALLNTHGAVQVEKVSLKGAVISGDLGLDGVEVRAFSATQCRFSGVSFDGATFTGAAWFDSATFTGAAWFDSATFTGAALFDSATFTGDARFDSATFTGDAEFRNSCAKSWSFTRAQFHSSELGP